VTAFEEAIRRWLQPRAQDAGDALAMDGKTLRGSADGAVPGVHLLAGYAPAADAVLAQLRVDAKSNEHKAALKLLGVLPVEGKAGLESRVHWVRDETPGEGRCRARKGSTPQVLAASRNAAVYLLGQVKAASKAAATRRLAAHPQEALALLLT